MIRHRSKKVKFPCLSSNRLHNPAMKKCFKCQTSKPLTEFYKHSEMADGHLGKCKQCTKKDVHVNFLIKQQDPEWAIKERERQRKKEEKRRVLGLVKKYTKGKYIRPTANNKMGNAVRSGKLIKLPCQVCGNQRTQGHHEDYSKPLDVVWLCTRHHADRHIHLRDRKTLSKKPMPIHKWIAAVKTTLPSVE
jgi:hypothetical protein